MVEKIIIGILEEARTGNKCNGFFFNIGLKLVSKIPRSTKTFQSFFCNKRLKL